MFDYLCAGMDSIQQVGAVGPVSKPKIICIEGNAGSGKSALIECLYGHPELHIIPNTTEHWKSFYGHNLMKLRHQENKNLNQFLFQLIVNLTRINQLSKIVSKKFKLVEGSWYSAYHVYGKDLFNHDQVNSLEYNILAYMHSILNYGLLSDMAKPDLIIYLRTTPENCLKRIEKTGKVEDRHITIEYLTNLHKAYEQWLGYYADGKYRNCPGSVPCPIVVLNGDVPETEYPILIREILDAIDTFDNSFSQNKPTAKNNYDLDGAIRRWRLKRYRGNVIDSQGITVDTALDGSQRDADLAQQNVEYHTKDIPTGLKMAKTLSLMGALGVSKENVTDPKTDADRAFNERIDKALQDDYDKFIAWQEANHCRWIQAMDENSEKGRPNELN